MGKAKGQGRMAFQNQIAGLVRFSYPARSGFAKKPDDIAALEATLYDPARLERRFHLFERLTLPSLMAQSDPDFTLAVLIGSGFPARDRLERALAPLRRARIVTLPVMHHYPATQAAFDAVLDPGASHLTSFRLDDDDAVDRHLVARLRATSAALSRMRAPGAAFAMGWNRGLFLELDRGGHAISEVIEKLPLGIGLALCAPVASRANIFARNHRLLPQFFDCWTDARTPAFIRTVHPGNDSSAHVSGRSTGLPLAEIETILAQHFPFTLADLLRL